MRQLRRRGAWTSAFRCSSVLVATVVMAAPSSLDAQGSVQGRLIDSLRTGSGVASAEVVLVGAGQRATTDRRGRFTFAAVPEGTYALAFHAPWLDSLGLPPLRRELTVRSGRSESVDLATPGAATYQRQVCGTELAAGQGILLGEVSAPDGRPRAGLPVAAQWTETSIAPGALSQRAIATADTTSASGTYLLCGVPRDAEVELWLGDAEGTEPLVAALNGDAVRRRDVVLGDGTSRVRVSGQVLDAGGGPIAGARISVIHDSLRLAETDEAGRFAVGALPFRSAQLVVRAVGFTPEVVDVEPTGTQLVLEPVRLRRVPFELSRVTVEGRALTVQELEFEYRRHTAVGHFVTEDQIKRYPVFQASALGTLTTRSRVSCGPGVCVFRLVRALGTCMPRLFVDGADHGVPDSVEQDTYVRIAKRVEVYRAAYAPARFNDFNGCGSLVIWTL